MGMIDQKNIKRMSARNYTNAELYQRIYDLTTDYEDLIEECRQMLIDNREKDTLINQNKIRRLTEIVSIYMGVSMEFLGLEEPERRDGSITWMAPLYR